MRTFSGGGNRCITSHNLVFGLVETLKGSSFYDGVLKRFFAIAQNDDNKRMCNTICAFTLAEVLITLGIIGVVAALTMPGLINNIKHKQLEVAFKSAYSIFSQAAQNIKREDMEGFGSYYSYFDNEKQINPNAPQFKDVFYKNSGLKVVGKCQYDDIYVKNYTKTTTAESYYMHFSNSARIILQDALSNGMCSTFTITASTIFFIVDINGRKAPNVLGHDVFFFKIDNNNDNLVPLKMKKLYTDEELEKTDSPYHYVMGDPCSTKSKQAGNGTGCSYYAVINQNPDDPSKGYWESLP